MKPIIQSSYLTNVSKFYPNVSIHIIRNFNKLSLDPVILMHFLDIVSSFDLGPLIFNTLLATLTPSKLNCMSNTHLKGDQCYQAKMLQVPQLKPNPVLPLARWLPVYLVLVLQVVFRYQRLIQIVSQYYKCHSKTCRFLPNQSLLV